MKKALLISAIFLFFFSCKKDDNINNKFGVCKNELHSELFGKWRLVYLTSAPYFTNTVEYNFNSNGTFSKTIRNGDSFSGEYCITGYVLERGGYKNNEIVFIDLGTEFFQIIGDSLYVSYDWLDFGRRVYIKN